MLLLTKNKQKKKKNKDINVWILVVKRICASIVLDKSADFISVLPYLPYNIASFYNILFSSSL